MTADQNPHVRFRFPTEAFLGDHFEHMYEEVSETLGKKPRMSIGRPCEFDGSPALYMDVQTTSEDAPFVRAIIDATVAAHLPTSGDPVPAWIEQHLVDQVAQAAQQRATTEAEQVALQEAHRAAVLSADLGAGVSPAQLANALTARSMRGCMP